jgi:hypothetical protein
MRLSLSLRIVQVQVFFFSNIKEAKDLPQSSSINQQGCEILELSR